MGFLDDAEVDVNDIPDDPFGFGNEFWPIRILEIPEPKVTKNGDKFGMMVKWAVDHPKYASHVVAKGLGQGNWMQLPVPKPLQGTIPWDPKSNPDDAKVLMDVRDLFVALGFPNDELGGVGPEQMVHRGCMAKIKPRKNDQGFWQFNLFNMRPFKEDEEGNFSEFTVQGTSNPGMTEEEVMKKEMDEL